LKGNHAGTHKQNTMKAYRYNCKNRSDRRFNNTGREKNPNAVKFYAKNMAYAEEYKFIYDDNGYIAQECKLEVVEIADDVKLFDMAANFKSLSVYKDYVAGKIQNQKEWALDMIQMHKKKSDKKKFQAQFDNAEFIATDRTDGLLRSFEFQSLSDYERQNQLIAELTAMGFEGYFTKNEIAIF
jgi:hypothetical protein